MTGVFGPRRRRTTWNSPIIPDAWFLSLSRSLSFEFVQLARTEEENLERERSTQVLIATLGNFDSDVRRRESAFVFEFFTSSNWNFHMYLFPPPKHKFPIESCRCNVVSRSTFCGIFQCISTGASRSETLLLKRTRATRRTCEGTSFRAAATIPRNAISRGPVLAIRDGIIPGRYSKNCLSSYTQLVPAVVVHPGEVFVLA